MSEIIRNYESCSFSFKIFLMNGNCTIDVCAILKMKSKLNKSLFRYVFSVFH